MPNETKAPQSTNPRRPYQKPRLEQQQYTVITGASIGINTKGLPNPFNQDKSNY